VAALRVVLVSYPIALVLLAGLAVVVGGQVSQGAVFWGALCGLSQALGVWWFYAALGSGPISVVSPLTAILVAALPVGVGLVMGERPGAIAGIGVVLALIAVVLVSREATDEDVTPHKFTATVAWLTVGSGVAFGLNLVLIAQAPAEANLWPLVFARLSASVLVLIIAAVSGNRHAAEAGRAGCAAGHRGQRRDAAGAACVAPVAGRRADVAVPGSHGVVGDSRAARTGDALAGRRHGIGFSCGCNDRLWLGNIDLAEDRCRVTCLWYSLEVAIHLLSALLGGGIGYETTVQKAGDRCCRLCSDRDGVFVEGQTRIIGRGNNFQHPSQTRSLLGAADQGQRRDRQRRHCLCAAGW
jgi:uncharacterized membrane protein